MKEVTDSLKNVLAVSINDQAVSNTWKDQLILMRGWNGEISLIFLQTSHSHCQYCLGNMTVHNETGVILQLLNFNLVYLCFRKASK